MGAIPALLLLILGLWLAIPSELDLGSFTIRLIENLSCKGALVDTPTFCSNLESFKILFNIAGLVLIAADILYIAKQLVRSKLF